MKRLAVILVCLAVTWTAAAGTAEAQLGSLGIKGGFQFSDFSDDDPVFGFALERRTGFLVGGYFDVGVGSLVLQPEILFSRRGAEIAAEVSVPEIVKAEVLVDYLEVPVLLKLRPPSAGVGTSPFLVVGPSVAYKLDARVRTELIDEMEDEQDITDELSDFDFSIVFGAGLSFGKLSVEARYVLGLTNVIDEPAPDDPSAKHRVLAILAGWTF